ncbi:hypothetical protein ACET94_16795 [Aeromonas veronii]
MSVDQFFYLLKPVLFLVGFIALYLNKGGVSLFIGPIAISGFLAGMEHATLAEKPWTFLLSSAATDNDYLKAILGGAMVCIIPVMLCSMFRRER